MSAIRTRCFRTLNEACLNARSDEQVFKVHDSARGETLYIAAKTHPIARSAATLYWRIQCTTVSESSVQADEMALENERLRAELEELRARTADTDEQLDEEVA